MAAFSSVKTGNWNDGDTWGNASPGVKGTDWPGLAGDTATINSGHTVTYNVSETNELGQITLDGTLYFSRSMSTKLVLGNVDIVVNATGVFDAGQTGDVIPTSYTCEVYFNTTSDNSKGFNFSDGGSIYFCGDNSFFGNIQFTRLSSDWSSGQTFNVDDDVSSSWQAGQTIWILRGRNAGVYSPNILTEMCECTIQSMTASSITVNEAHPGWTSLAYAMVINVSRNVKWGKLNASMALNTQNSLRPRVYGTQSTGNNNLRFIACEIHGLFAMGGNIANNYMYNIVARCGYGLMTQWTNMPYIHGIVHMVTYNHNFYGGEIDVIGIYTSWSQFRKVTFKGHYAISFNILAVGDGMCIDGADIFSCGGQGRTGNNFVYNNCFLYDCYNHVHAGMAELKFIDGGIGYTRSGLSKPNSYDFSLGCTQIECYNVKLPLSGDLTIYGQGNHRAEVAGFLRSVDHGQTKGAVKKWMNSVTLIKNDSKIRTGGAPSSIEITPMLVSAVYDANWLALNPPFYFYDKVFEWQEQDVPASAQTRVFYAILEGWNGGANIPNDSEFYVEAEYYNHAVNLTTAYANSTMSADASAWGGGVTGEKKKLTVTFTPAQVGMVRYRLFLKKYYAASKAYFDNAIFFGEMKSDALWINGESRVHINQDEWTTTTIPKQRQANPLIAKGAFV